MKRISWSSLIATLGASVGRPQEHRITQDHLQKGSHGDLAHPPMLPKRNSEHTNKDEEKETTLLQQEIRLKLDLANTLTQRRHVVHKLRVMMEQCRMQQALLADVAKDMEALGQETHRISQVIAVLKKIEIVISQEHAKL